MADAERIDEAVEPHVAARLDGREQLLRRGRAPTLALLKLGGGAAIAGLKGEDVRRRLDQALVVERLDVLLAEPLDIEGVARDEMLEALDPLGRADKAAGAAPHGIDLAGDGIDLAHGMAAASRAQSGKDELFRALRPLLLNHAENLRDDVAGALDDDRVADADVLALDLILVMQRRVLHHDAADGHRLELGHRRKRAGAADLDLDVVQHRGRLLGGEFMGNGEARRARHVAQALLEIEAVELIDDAVDVVVEAGAAGLRFPYRSQASPRRSASAASAD